MGQAENLSVCNEVRRLSSEFDSGFKKLNDLVSIKFHMLTSYILK